MSDSPTRSVSPSPSVASTSRPRSLRTTVSSEPLSAHPLLASPTGSAGGVAPLSTTPEVQYPVYSGGSHRKRHSTVQSNASAVSGATEAVSPTGTTAPKSFLPPLISRASNSNLPHPPSPPGGMGNRSVSEATAKLLGQRVKSDLQGLGLGGDSTGSALVAKFGERQPLSAEWRSAIDQAALPGVTLLLPADRAPATTSPTVLLDHLVRFAEPSPDSSSPRAFTTLTGLRGYWVPQEAQLRFVSHGAASTSAAGPTSFPDPTHPAFSKYPAIPLLSSSSDISSLAVPRVAPSTAPSPQAPSRTPSRLAALFGPRTDESKDKDAGLPPIVPAPPGLLDASSTSSPSTSNIDLRVLTVASTISRDIIKKSIQKACDSFVRARVSDEAAADKCIEFVTQVRAQPPPKSSDHLLVLAEKWQNVMSAIWVDCARAVAPPPGSPTPGVPTLSADDQDRALEDSLETVETTVLSLLFDSLLPPEDFDTDEDRVLDDKFAALRDAGFSLRSLGIDLDNDQLDENGWADGSLLEALEDILALATSELKKLSSDGSRTPREKIKTLVSVHKIIVDGLSSLPPIPLKDPPTSASLASRLNGGSDEVEMDDAASLSSRFSRPSSPSKEGRTAPEKEIAEDSQRTPKSAKDVAAYSPIPELKLDPLAQSVTEATTTSVFDTASINSSSSTSRNGSPSTSSADLILPLLIYLLAQASPLSLRLSANLDYIQRFRTQGLMKGEAAYCVTNLLAATSFLRDTTFSELGLPGLDPPAATPSVSGPNGVLASSRASIASSAGSIRLKGQLTNVSHELDHFVDSANATLVNVVDSSYRMLFGPKGFAPKTLEDVKNVLDGAGSVASKARGSLMRRQTSPAGFFLPQGVEGNSTDGGANQKEMVDVGAGSNVKEEVRPSINERLASIAKGVNGSSSLTTPTSSASARRATIAHASPSTASPTMPVPALPSHLLGTAPRPTPPPLPPRSPSAASIAPSRAPITQRFLDCTDAGELRISDVALLLDEYKSLVREVETLRQKAADAT